ncbi:MAG: hypothetical protein O2955_14015 [Planctomycetota bacterium]|nr:hypothetical protein [Planctomycetota bacterium]MDA1213627.1 hypothetical protein [Planctomycetota bacterium]
MTRISLIDAMFVLAIAVMPATLVAQTETQPFPEWTDVEAAVQIQLAEISYYEPGDIIAQDDVAPLWDQFAEIGWTVDTDVRKEYTQHLLPSSDFLVKKLRETKLSRKFMRQIARLPNGYDRTDRLRRLPYGERRIKELIRGPDGYKLIEYMTTSEGGKNLGRQLSRDPGGKNFNSTTGILYTETMLLESLKSRYDEAVAAAN